MQLWDIAGVIARPIGRPFADGTLSVAFSHNGTRLATVAAGSEGYGPVQLWDVAGTAPRSDGRPFAGPTSSAWFSQDGTMLATAASFSIGGNSGRVVTSAGKGVQLWNVATRKPIGAPVGGVNGGADAAAFSPDGSILATAGADGTVRLWSIARIIGRPVSSMDTSVDGTRQGAIALSPDGTTLAAVAVAIAGNSTIVRLWNTGTRRPVGKPFASGTDWVVFSPDGKVLATGQVNGSVQLWEVTSAGPQPMRKPFTDASWLAFSPDGTMAATVSSDGGFGSPVQLWHFTRAGPQPFGHPLGSANGGPGSVVFSPDGTKLAVIGEQDYSAGADGATIFVEAGPVQLWNTRTGKMIGSAFADVNGGAYQAAFSPDGTMLVTLGGDGAARLWNAVTRRQIGSPINGAAYSAAFSPDGKVLATGGIDSKARLWDIATRQQIGSPISSGTTPGPIPVAFLRNGTVLATEDGSTEQLWAVGYLVDPLSRLCSQAGGSFTPSEWAQYVPPGPAYQNGCLQPHPAIT